MRGRDRWTDAFWCKHRLSGNALHYLGMVNPLGRCSGKNLICWGEMTYAENVVHPDTLLTEFLLHRIEWHSPSFMSKGLSIFQLILTAYRPLSLHRTLGLLLHQACHQVIGSNFPVSIFTSVFFFTPVFFKYIIHTSVKFRPFKKAGTAAVRRMVWLLGFLHAEHN